MTTRATDTQANAANVYGVKEIIKRLYKLEEKVRQKLERGALRDALEPIKQEALRRVPELDGGLRASIESRIVRRKGVYAAQVRARAPHAHLMEFGWWWTSHAGRRIKRISPQPPTQGGGFLRPALYGNQNKVRSIFIQTIEQALRESQSND